MKQTIFIIGAGSALAQDVMPALAQDNTIVTAGRKGCDVYCDIAKPFTIPAGVDVVINFAAAFGGGDDAAFVDTQKTNVQGTLNVCMAAKAANVKHIINISSIFALLDENSPYYSAYALTKKQADELAQYYCRINTIPLTTLRPSQIYGDSDSFAKHQPFFYTIIDKAQKGEDITIYGTNDARRNFIHSADLAETIRRVVEKRIEGVFACMNPSDVSYSQIAQAAQSVFNKGGKVIFQKDMPDIADNIFAKDVAIYEATKQSLPISIEDGMRRIKDHRTAA